MFLGCSTAECGQQQPQQHPRAAGDTGLQALALRKGGKVLRKGVVFSCLMSVDCCIEKLDCFRVVHRHSRIKIKRALGGHCGLIEKLETADGYEVDVNRLSCSYGFYYAFTVLFRRSCFFAASCAATRFIAPLTIPCALSSKAPGLLSANSWQRSLLQALPFVLRCHAVQQPRCGPCSTVVRPVTRTQLQQAAEGQKERRA